MMPLFRNVQKGKETKIIICTKSRTELLVLYMLLQLKISDAISFFCPSAIWTCDAQDGAREEMFRQMRPLGWPGGVFSTNHDQIQNYHITYPFFGQTLQEKMTRST